MKFEILTIWRSSRKFYPLPFQKLLFSSLSPSPFFYLLSFCVPLNLPEYIYYLLFLSFLHSPNISLSLSLPISIYFPPVFLYPFFPSPLPIIASFLYTLFISCFFNLRFLYSSFLFVFFSFSFFYPFSFLYLFSFLT